MSIATLALTVLGMGLITYGIRLSFFLLPEATNMPPWVMRGLYYVPTAVLSAIILPEMILSGGVINLTLTNERLLAGVIAALIAWRTRNVLLTVAVGMLALWLLQTLFR